MALAALSLLVLEDDSRAREIVCLTNSIVVPDARLNSVRTKHVIKSSSMA